MVNGGGSIKIFPKSLAEQRQLRTGLNQVDFCQKHGFKLDTLKKLETGRARPRMKTMGKLAEAFGVPVGDLIKLLTRPPNTEELSVEPGAMNRPSAQPAEPMFSGDKITLSPTARSIAQAGAKVQGVTVEQWVNLTIENLKTK